MAEDGLRSRVLGQDQSIDGLVCSLAPLFSGLRDRSRPILTTLLLGPTGVGKTETAKALAQALFGSDEAMTRINCEELAHSHETAKLLGAPPGYIGFGESPLLSRTGLAAPFEKAVEEGRGQVGEDCLVEPAESGQTGVLSIVLFDEIEKAHSVVWNALLGILDDGVLTLGTGEVVDFTSSIILLTSNVGGQEMSKLLDGRQVGFHDVAPNLESRSEALEQAALSAAKRHFPAEFLNRFDQISVFRPLATEVLESILDHHLGEIHERALAAETPILLRVGRKAREHILEEGSDPRFGARPLRRAVEREIVGPLSRLIASHRIEAGDIVEVELDRERLAFFRVGRGEGSLKVDAALG